jgi:uncharacterized repeat protein (TIGR03803 family)
MLLAPAAVPLFLNAANAQLRLTVLHSFTGQNEGEQPYAELVQGKDLALYGTTYLGGTNSAGTVFKLNPDGPGNTVIYNFGGNHIDPFGLAYPSGPIQGADGGLYRTTGFGGAAGNGSVFRLNPNGTGYSVLHSFSTIDGYEPVATVVQGRDGNLYGTTQLGGIDGAGTVFKVSTNGNGFVQLYAFGMVDGDGRSPQAPLLQGTDGALYGTSSAGGSSALAGGGGYGSIFKLNTDGTAETVLHSFLPSGGDGQRPYGGLIQDDSGAPYGTTQEGGTNANGGASGFGTVFKLNPDGTGYRILHSFNVVFADGKYPNSTLVLGNDGALYGTTEYGGAKDLGSVFKLTRDGSQYTVLYSFGSHPGDGSYPKAPLIRAASGGLFGTAQFAGSADGGTLFRLNPAPSVISLVTAQPQASPQLSLTAPPHFQYQVQGSNDGVHWTVLTNVDNPTGTVEITPENSNSPRRFYRSAWVP